MRRSARPDPQRFPYLDAGSRTGPDAGSGVRAGSDAGGGVRAARAPLALAHRGFAPDGGENTMDAIERAVGLGFRYVEIDVRASSDGVVMVFHDEHLNRVTDARGPLVERSAAELGAVSVEGRGGIPTLGAVLLRWPELRLNIDIKTDDAVQPFAELINRLRAHDRVLVASFSDRRRRQVLRLLEEPTASSAGMRINAGVKVAAPLGLAGIVARRAGVQALQVPEIYRGVRVVTPRFVAACHAAGLQVHVWTINRREDMDRLLDLGVDGLVSDAGDVLAECLAERSTRPGSR